MTEYKKRYNAALERARKKDLPCPHCGHKLNIIAYTEQGNDRGLDFTFTSHKCGYCGSHISEDRETLRKEFIENYMEEWKDKYYKKQNKEKMMEKFTSGKSFTIADIVEYAKFAGKGEFDLNKIVVSNVLPIQIDGLMKKDGKLYLSGN